MQVKGEFWHSDSSSQKSAVVRVIADDLCSGMWEPLFMIGYCITSSTRPVHCISPLSKGQNNLVLFCVNRMRLTIWRTLRPFEGALEKRAKLLTSVSGARISRAFGGQ